MSEIEREIRRQRWMARQRMLAAMVAIQEAKRISQIQHDDGVAHIVRIGAHPHVIWTNHPVMRIGAYLWAVWTEPNGRERAVCLGRVTP